MLNEEMEKLRAQVFVTGHFAAKHLALSLAKSVQDRAQLAGLLAQWQTELRTVTWEGRDPAIADLRSAEIEKAGAEFLQMLKDNLKGFGMA
jgi:tripartite-type tricarboxylate transporter receptor subunit TctC